jgi:pseudaminic acid synthase
LVEVIAEIGNAHGGSFVRAIRLLDAAKECGADWAKLQTYTAKELVSLRGNGPAPEPWGSQGFTMETLYDKAKTPLTWIPALFKHAASIGLPIFSSVFGLASLAVLEEVGCPMYKVAALDAHKTQLTDHVRATTKAIVLSTTDRKHGEWATHRLWCPVGYPQTEFEFRKAFDDGEHREGWAFDGFSYHGTNPRIPVVAVAAGALLVEAHFQLDSEPNELEANVSLGEKQFAGMVREIREVEALLG